MNPQRRIVIAPRLQCPSSQIGQTATCHLDLNEVGPKRDLTLASDHCFNLGSGYTNCATSVLTVTGAFPILVDICGFNKDVVVCCRPAFTELFPPSFLYLALSIWSFPSDILVPVISALSINRRNLLSSETHHRNVEFLRMRSISATAFEFLRKVQFMTRELAGLRDVRAVLFDMDGVIYVGTRLLPGVQEAIDYLTSTGRLFLFVTNNPSTTSEQFVKRLAEMNVYVRPEQVLGSAEATAVWLADQVTNHGWPRGPVIVTGQDGLKIVLQKNGFELTTDPREAKYAVAGINFKLTYEELANMTLAIRGGAKLIGTNPDTNYPSERGPLPGAGSILALLTAASGQQPLVIGKPNRGMYEQAMARLNVTGAQTLMVGDRYETDISGAIRLGLWTAGVLTGISTRGDFERASPPPDLIADNLPELVNRLRWADQQKPQVHLALF